MTDELWKRLTDRVLLTNAETIVRGNMLQHLGVGDAAGSIKCHQMGFERGDTFYWMLIPADQHKDLVILSSETNEGSRVYLLDMTRKLLRAATADKDGTRSLDLKIAQESLVYVLKLWTRAAGTFPATK